MKKYELTNETINIENKKLFRIKALKDFGCVKAGDLGGYVENENNLSQENNCWIYNNARVYGDAVVSGNAWVFDDAKVFDNAAVFGKAWVFENAKVYDDARVFGKAEVYGKAKVLGEAWVYDNARVYNGAEVFGNARVFENACVYRNDRVFGNDRVYGGVKNLVPKNLHNENNLKGEKMTNKRTEELFNNLVTYIVELVGGVEYVGTLKDSIGFTDDELIECGIDLNDIEEYNRK